MERPRLTPPPLLVVVMVLMAMLTVPQTEAAATTATQLGTDYYRATILAQVDTMDNLLTNITRELQKALEPTEAPTEAPTEPPEPAEPVAVQDVIQMLPHRRIFSRRSAEQQGPELPRTLFLEAPAPADSTTACKKEEVDTTLSESAKVLDRVSAGEFTPDTQTDMDTQNTALGKFLTDCSLSAMSADDADSLLVTVAAVESHVVAARAASTPGGLEVNSAFMIVLISLSCMMAVGALIGLAVLAYRYTATPSGPSSGDRAKRAAAARDAQADRERRGDVGRPNPAYEPTNPPGSLHQARNDRWQRGEVDPQPHRPPAASKSTWGRIWGGVVRDYQRARDSVAEPPRRTSPPPRRGSPPPRRSSPPRRASPPPRRASPPPRRASPPPRRASPPPRRASPPPRRYSPPPPPQSDGGDNWAYGPSGRNKSTDSPFTSAW